MYQDSTVSSIHLFSPSRDSLNRTNILYYTQVIFEALEDINKKRLMRSLEAKHSPDMTG